MPRIALAMGIACLAISAASHAEFEERLDAIDRYVTAYEDMAAFDGVVLIVDGDTTVYRKAFGMADYSLGVPMPPEGVFRIASLSKQVTQAAIGRLVDQGMLTLQSRLSDFLPDFPNARRISIRQLLDHTAGIAHTNRLEWMNMRQTYTLDEIVDGLAGEPLQFAPGADNQYSNGGYALLAKIIEVTSGLSFAEFIEREFAEQGFPSIGHETAYQVVPGMVSRYAPGPIYGQRVLAEPYMTVNRIGGGSLFASADDVLRFFRACFEGDLLSAATTAALFPVPDDDLRITGRAPGALAQVHLDFDNDLTVVTLSSNTAWPGSFNADIVALYMGQDASLTGFTVSKAAVSEPDRNSITGHFIADRFGWEWQVVTEGNQFAIIQDALHTAFVRTTDGEFHLPVYDWLCRYGDYGTEFECRQRDPDAEIRFRFTRR